MVARSCNFPSNICLKCPDLLSLLSPHPLTDRTGLHSPALRWFRILLRQRNHRQCCECAARREPEGSCGKRDRVGNLQGSIETHKVWVKLAHVNRLWLLGARLMTLGGEWLALMAAKWTERNEEVSLGVLLDYMAGEPGLIQHT